MDFDVLLKDGIITQSTRTWFEPQWQKQQEDAKELQETVHDNLFDDGNHDEELLFDCIDDVSITINGVDFPYFRDDHSVGHGNRVWHASIATCLYIESLLDTMVIPSGASFQILELGAGTALPSLYLAQILVEKETASRPFLHITDGKHYRNIQQIILSICRQSSKVRDRVHFRASPHNWGEGIGVGGDNLAFFQDECLEDVPNRYDIVLVSDCIYNPNFHASLLESIAATMKLPDGDKRGGRAIISFSLHGNIKDEIVWEFLEMANDKCSADGKWHLHARPIENREIAELHDGNMVLEYIGRGGWNMEEKMRQLNLWAANVDPQRWIAYLYELTWTRVL